MATIEINDSDLMPLKSKVILITGGSSGIGLASVKLFLSLGAKVVAGDINPCPLSSDDLTYHYLDVTNWESQLEFFKKAIGSHGRVDHVFANAGITSVATYMEENLDDNGDPQPPNNKTLDINLMGVIYTCKLGMHYLKKQPGGGSIVITGSASSVSPFALTDYNVSKHAVLGLTRGLHANLAQHPEHHIRINMLAPLWTASGMVPDSQMSNLGVSTQPPEAVARSAALCMADESRNGQVIYSRRGLFREIGQPLLKTAIGLMATEEDDRPKDVETGRRMNEMLMGKSTL